MVGHDTRQLFVRMASNNIRIHLHIILSLCLVQNGDESPLSKNLGWLLAVDRLAVPAVIPMFLDWNFRTSRTYSRTGHHHLRFKSGAP
jgi:hypothetical protein